MTLSETYANYIRETIEELVSKGGERLDEETAIYNHNQCKKNECGLYELHQVLPWYEDYVCMDCKCVASIKSKFKIHRDPKTLRLKKTTCPKGLWKS